MNVHINTDPAFAEDFQTHASDEPHQETNPCEVDSDNDGAMDCQDECPFNHEKIVAGECGCGVYKVSPGQCGCGIWDADTDGDGVADCVDLCPFNELKKTPDECGCEKKLCPKEVEETPMFEVASIAQDSFTQRELSEEVNLKQEMLHFLLDDRILLSFLVFAAILIYSIFSTYRYISKNPTEDLPIQMKPINKAYTNSYVAEDTQTNSILRHKIMINLWDLTQKAAYNYIAHD
eukprot:augustus_masked-scaffold_5-processed-gene-5.16-mRNA-1 protein AED:0.25 eAED:0.33 QI:0/0/0/0.5/1/1/2/0/233